MRGVHLVWFATRKMEVAHVMNISLVPIVTVALMDGMALKINLVKVMN